MATYSEERDQVILTSRDYDVLTALLGQPLNGYEVARQCETDQESRPGSISTGGIQYSLKGLLSCTYIQKTSSATSRSGYDYEITSGGVMALKNELSRLRKKVKLIEDRQRKLS